MSIKLRLAAALVAATLVTGCASVPLAAPEQDAALKTFAKPPADKAGLYVFRNSFVGQALKKSFYIDGALIGETSNKVFFYQEITPGTHQVSTESEFSDNAISLEAVAGTNYFIEQYIKMGAFVGGANLRVVNETEGMAKVRECRLAR